MDCLTGPDGIRRFVPQEGVEPFLLKASLGGLPILAKTRCLSAEQRFSYHAMRLLFQHAPLLREHLDRSFTRKSDLYIPGVERSGRDRKNILPERVGLGRDGRGHRWTVPELLRHGRKTAVERGKPRPNLAQCIAVGLHVAARLDALEPASLSESEARSLVRMALFDVGPVSGIDAAAKQAVAERLLVAVERHDCDDADAFTKWFFMGRDNLIHQIAKKKRGGAISRDIVRQAFLDLVVESFQYVGDCMFILMSDFVRALPTPLSVEERALFSALYFKQPYLGGLSLILLRNRFEFLKGAILDILNANGDPGAVGVLLRLLAYYEEMASKRREVDRGYKRRGQHRNAKGRVAQTLPLEAEPAEKAPAVSSELFRTIAERLCDERGIRCACRTDGSWQATLLGGDGKDDGVVVSVECDECGRSVKLKVGQGELERIGREIIRSKSPSAHGG